MNMRKIVYIDLSLSLSLSNPKFDRSRKLIVSGKRKKRLGREDLYSQMNLGISIFIFIFFEKKTQKRTRSPGFEVDDSAQCFQARETGKR